MLDKKPVLLIGGKSKEELDRIYEFTHKIFTKQTSGYRVVGDYEAIDSSITRYAYVVAIQCDDERKAFELGLLFLPMPFNDLIHYKPFS